MHIYVYPETHHVRIIYIRITNIGICIKYTCRWIAVNVANETQFNLKYEEEWFDVGRFWDAPCNTAAFGHSSFSGSSTYWGAAGHHGVSGAALFYLQIPGELKEHPITIAFSNPGTGSIKTRAEFSQDMKEVWKRMDKQCTHNAEKDVLLGIQQTKFQLTSTPGSQAKVTITQVCMHTWLLLLVLNLHGTTSEEVAHGYFRRMLI